jgi:catechol 2,3-dioxygenase-like lactoylglutathione lyase family enzyme
MPRTRLPGVLARLAGRACLACLALSACARREVALGRLLSPLATLAAAPTSKLAPIARSGHVKFSQRELRGDASSADRAALVDAVTDLFEAWLATDAPAYLARLAPGATRQSPELARIDRDPTAITATLGREWSAFERPKGRLAMDVTIRDATLAVDGDGDGDATTVTYRVDVSGKRGTRWTYDDLWLVRQTFLRTADGLRLAHEARAVGLDEATSAPQRSFTFEFAVPVDDLARAVKFYTPLLGAPEWVAADRAVYAGGGTRLRLDASRLGGRAAVRKGLPNGYGIFLVPDRIAEEARLRAAGVRFLTDAGAKAPDEAGRGGQSIGMDPDGNVFALEERRAIVEASGAPGAATVEPAEGVSAACVGRVREGLEAWLRADASALEATTWFDDRRARAASFAQGRAAVAAALKASFASYDRSPGGLAARGRAHALSAMTVGGSTILSYRLELASTGARGFRELSLATEVWKGGCESGRREGSFFAKAAEATGHVREVDYTGYPAEDLNAANDFYQRTMRLGAPYRDQGWRGFWSTHAVFGVFEASRDDDRIPVARRANGYVSFWVASAIATHAYLRGAGVDFPVVPAINTHAGVEKAGGYTQIVANDSEGNLTVFTEYTGR